MYSLALLGLYSALSIRTSSVAQSSSSGNKNKNSVNQGSTHNDLKAACFPANFWLWRNDLPLFPPGCDKCIWDLTDDLRLAALSIEESKSGLLSVSSGAAAHRHVNEINSTIYLLKVCRNVVPSALFSFWFHGVTSRTPIPFDIWVPWLCYRLLDLGNYEKVFVTMSFSLNQELPSIKEVNMESEMTES